MPAWGGNAQNEPTRKRRQGWGWTRSETKRFAYAPPPPATHHPTPPGVGIGAPSDPEMLPDFRLDLHAFSSPHPFPNPPLQVPVLLSPHHDRGRSAEDRDAKAAAAGSILPGLVLNRRAGPFLPLAKSKAMAFSPQRANRRAERRGSL